MPGQRSKEGGTFISPRDVYRNLASVAADSADDLLDDTEIPTLDTSEGPNAKQLPDSGDNNQYGTNAQLDLAVLLGDGVTSLTLELWMLAPIEQKPLIPDPDNPPVPPVLPTNSVTGHWVFVSTVTYTKSTLWITKDIPPGTYKVRISAFVGAGGVALLEAHAC